MTKENYIKAKKLREQIQQFEVTQTKVRHMRERTEVGEEDPDFNTLRQLAFDGCQFAIDTLEKEFKEL